MSVLQPYIADLAQKTGLLLELSPDGSFTALLGRRRLLVQAVDNSEAFLFYMEVGRPTLFRRGEVLASLMGGNLFLAETKGAALSYDAFNEVVGLNLILPLHHLESDHFLNALENIVTAAGEWGRKLEALNAGAEERARQAGETLVFEGDGAAQGASAPGDASPLIRV
ncbi:MAG: type III secretion system chaperone [Desulfovibrionaceae bacterium]|nr:type III secretion system chaperone [Desulfovibrionaceae bacterium]